MIRWQEREDGIGVVSLSRPPVNAFDTPSKLELDRLLRELEQRTDIRTLVFRSDLPRTFSAGSDLRELASEHAVPGVAWQRTSFEFDMWQRLSGLPQISIAAVDGHALGSGLELAVACDLRIAGAAARFGLPEIRIGGAPGIQVLARLPALVGLGVATRMLLEGDPMTADEAATVRLVHEVVPDGGAEERALELARELAARPRSSIRFLKASLSAALDAASGAVAKVAESQVESLFQASEMGEGIGAFLEKRQPRFEVHHRAGGADEG